MRVPKAIAGWLALIGAMLTPLGAHAAVKVFDLTLAESSHMAGPFGTVQVTENAGALDFLVTLNSNFRFALGDANHNGIAFDLIGNPLITISSLTSGFARRSGTSFNESPFGAFQYAIRCSTCGSSFASDKAGPLSFKVTANTGSLSLASLGYDVYNGKDVFFVAAVIDSCGCWGNVAAVGLPVPEPGTWALLILGFGLTGVALRRRRGALAASGI